jgi:hypothetical protein
MRRRGGTVGAVLLMLALTGCSLLYSKDVLMKEEAETQEIIRQEGEILRQLDSLRQQMTTLLVCVRNGACRHDP